MVGDFLIWLFFGALTSLTCRSVLSKTALAAVLVGEAIVVVVARTLP
jgi:hypothetical protein